MQFFYNGVYFLSRNNTELLAVSPGCYSITTSAFTDKNCHNYADGRTCQRMNWHRRFWRCQFCVSTAYEIDPVICSRNQ